MGARPGDAHGCLGAEPRHPLRVSAIRVTGRSEQSSYVSIDQWPLGVIQDPGGRSRTIVHVRFAPKGTVGDQGVIRRFVPNGDILRCGKRSSLFAVVPP